MTPMGPIYQDDDFDGVTAQEIAVFIGPNYRRYLSVFKMMRDSGHNFSFNWSAFFFNYCFLFYRKLYRPAIVVMSLVAMLFIPRLMYSSESIKYFLNVYMQVPVDYDLGLLNNLGTLISIINIVQLALMWWPRSVTASIIIMWCGRSKNSAVLLPRPCPRTSTSPCWRSTVAPTPEWVTAWPC